MRSTLPNFRGRRALVLHRPDSNRETLTRQLEKLGLLVDVRWPADRIKADGFDVLFFDADMGYDALFSWPADQPPIPLIALMGSEAPGRIEWTISRTPAAYLIKPIGSTGVFSALAIAFHTFETQRDLKAAITELTRRAKARPIVLKAILIVMAELGISDTEAFQLIRTQSMNERMSVEDLSGLVVNRGYAEVNRMAQKSKGSTRQAN